MNPKRIAIVAPAVRTGADRGFYNRQDIGLGRALAQLGHEVTILKAAIATDSLRREELAPRCVLHEIPGPSLGSHGWVGLKQLKATRPDAVILFSDLQLSVPAIGRWCRRRRIPFAHVVGTIESSKRADSLFSRWTLWRNLREFKTSSVIAKTDAVASQLRNLGTQNVTSIPVGLDVENLRPPSEELRAEARQIWGISEDAAVLGFVGRLEAYKNPLLLPEILASLTAEREKWTLLLVGDGSLSEELDKRFAQASVADSVIRVAKIPNAEMWRLYAAADVLVNLNAGEIFGMAIIEAMFYGTPVVAVDAPGPCMIIRDGIDGFITPSNPALLSEKIRLAYSSKASLGPAAQTKVAQNFTWQSIAAQMTTLISSGDPV